MEYLSESAPPWSGEDGGKFPAPSLTGQALVGLPCSWVEGALAACPLPVFSAGSIFTAEGGGTPH